jgi:ATP-dependent DNA helicase RecQ
MEHLCLVVSPLIALMKDQVEQLQKRNIKAEAIFSGLERNTIDKILDHAIDGKIKFLYLSPERLQTEAFKQRLKSMKISLLAIDEAHCISQWGYDFRPPYLQIAEVRDLLPDVPLIALTASATEKVKADIREKLKFGKNSQTFQRSFARPNLSYSVFKVEDKVQKIIDILRKVPGSAVIYTRNRRRTQELADFLQKAGLTADYYHAGLNPHLRSEKQDKWIKNQIRIIVATNAFGMGIDKADVRVVIHHDLPDSLEAYYQEAGRAGRDEKKAYAIALYADSDFEDLEKKIMSNYPEPEYVKKIYQALANYFGLAINAGEMAVYDFDLADFQRNYNLENLESYYALKLLEHEGFIEFNEAYYHPARFMFTLAARALYEFQMKNPKAEPIIKVLQRMYGGEAHQQFVNISESSISHHLNINSAMVVKQLERLQALNVIAFNPAKEKPQIWFLTPRYDAQKLPLNQKNIEKRKNRDLERVRSVIQYADNQQRCRTLLILEYFGEVNYEACGICDTCLKHKRQQKELSISPHFPQIKEVLNNGPLAVKLLIDKLTPLNEKEALNIIRQLIDNQILAYQDDGRIMLKDG